MEFFSAQLNKFFFLYTMKATIFADRGTVTAISFPGEAMNFNGVAVHEVEAPRDDFEAALLAVVPHGVGSPWPSKDSAAPDAPVPRTQKPKAAKP